MLNTFLARSRDGNIQTLDDLTIFDRNAAPRYGISKSVPNIWAYNLTDLNELIREVSGPFRTELQQVDDDIEALMNLREDIRTAAFDQGQYVGAANLETFLE